VRDAVRHLSTTMANLTDPQLLEVKLRLMQRTQPVRACICLAHSSL
jgi:hypothetical protein